MHVHQNILLAGEEGHHFDYFKIFTVQKVRHLCCKISTILGYNDVTGNSYSYVHKCFTFAGQEY